MTKLTEYKGLVLAALEITPADPEHGDEVEFTDNCSGGRAVFLMKVKEIETGKFKAKYVSPERAARHVELFPKLNKTNEDTSPLFVVHGFNVQPASNTIYSRQVYLKPIFDRRSPIFSGKRQ